MHGSRSRQYKIPYHTIPCHTIPQNTKSYQIPNISNGHNLVNFQVSSPKFSIVVDLGNTNTPYHKIPCHTTPQNIKSYQTPNISNGQNADRFQARSTKFLLVLDLGNTMPYHTIKYQIIPNIKYWKRALKNTSRTSCGLWTICSCFSKNLIFNRNFTAYRKR